MIATAILDSLIKDGIIDDEVDRNCLSMASCKITVSFTYALDQDQTIPCSECGIPIPEPDEDLAKEDAIAAAMCDCCYGVENA